MKIILALCFALFALSSTSAEVRRYLYCSTPDGAQREGKSGAGILVFDIDNGQLLWSHKCPVRYGDLSYGTGPRTTPTVVDDQIARTRDPALREALRALGQRLRSS